MTSRDIKEPLIHSGISVDDLPEDHPLAWENIHCHWCGATVHCELNDIHRPWIETNSGAYCVPCWDKAYEASGYPERDLGLWDDSLAERDIERGQG